jgi:D-sedoheptulose 7-phosphate isomerase
MSQRLSTERRLEDLFARFPALRECRESLLRAFGALRDCYAAGGKVLLCGNGGSAADAEHWSGELMKGFCHPRPLPSEWKSKLGEDIADGLQEGLPAIPLPAFMSLLSAYANDVDAAMAFAQMVWALGRQGDVLVCLSTSGNSVNVLKALRVAHAKGMVTVGLTGAGGGEMAPLVDVCVKAPATGAHLVQELHLPIYHCLSLMLEDEFFA